MQNITPWIAWLQRRLLWRGRACLLVIMAGATLGVVPAIGNSQTSEATRSNISQTNIPANPSAKSAPRQPVAAEKAAPAAEDVAAPAAPAPPQWPVNDPAQQASVRLTAQGLSIEARNSSLKQILDSVQSQIGVRIQGLNKDERVFGVYGPGQPREVLSQLLEGTDYNLLMVGNGAHGVPQQIVLSKKPEGGPQPNAPVAPGDMYQPPVAPYQPPQPLPPPPGPGSHPPQAPRTPQQILQEMQQREQIMRQQQMQQQNPEQQEQHQEQEQQ